jgi:hypothetical protein
LPGGLKLALARVDRRTQASAQTAHGTNRAS